MLMYCILMPHHAYQPRLVLPILVHVYLVSLGNQWQCAMQALSLAHEGQPNTAQQQVSEHPSDTASTPAAEPDQALAAPQLQAFSRDADQRRNGAPALPPIPEDCESELPQIEQHEQTPSQALAASSLCAVEELAAPQEPEQAQVPPGTGRTGDPSPTSDSPSGFLIQSDAVHASLAACMEATPAQQQHGPPALTAQHVGSPDTSSDPSSPAEAPVLAEQGLAEAAEDVPEVTHRGGQHCRELPHMSPMAEESDMGFSPGANTLRL